MAARRKLSWTMLVKIEKNEFFDKTLIKNAKKKSTTDETHCRPWCVNKNGNLFFF